MNRNWKESRRQWEVELWERQHNLTPAEITCTSQHRASGLPRNAPLPVTFNAARLRAGLGLVPLGIIGATIFSNQPWMILVSLTGVTGPGLYLILAALEWTEE